MGFIVIVVGLVMVADAFSKQSPVVDAMRPWQAIVGAVFVVGGLIYSAMVGDD